MSRQYPIHLMDSDENITEPDYDSDATSVYENQPTVPTPTPNPADGVDETKNTTAEPPLKKLKTTHQEWMPQLLKHWRMLEGIPSTYEIGESSQTPPPLTLTGEPVDITVPTLVAVLYSLLRDYSATYNDIKELQSDVSRLNGDMTSTYERLELIEGHTNLDNEAAHATRARVEMLEERARVAEVVAGVSLLMTGFMAVVGMYLTYLR